MAAGLVAAILSAAPLPAQAPADSLQIVQQFLAELRRGWQRVEAQGAPAWRDSLLEVQIGLGGRAGTWLRTALRAEPLYLVGDTAPLRTLSVDSLVFVDTLAHLFTTASGRQAEPGPWWEDVRRRTYRWDVATRTWRLWLSISMRATDGYWTITPAPAPARPPVGGAG